jgi:hypothetical protein
MHCLGFFATVFWTVVCVLGGVGWAATEDAVREDRIKVFLFAAPAFFSEVAVDGWKDACVSLDNNLFVALFSPYSALWLMPSRCEGVVVALANW